jgi:hypothetical protein
MQEPQALEYHINWDIYTQYTGAAGILLHINENSQESYKWSFNIKNWNTPVYLYLLIYELTEIPETRHVHYIRSIRLVLPRFSVRLVLRDL